MLTGGMPGVSGEANISGPPMSAFSAKEPGVVPSASVEGLVAPCSGAGNRSLSVGESGGASPLRSVMRSVVRACALAAGLPGMRCAGVDFG